MSRVRVALGALLAAGALSPALAQQYVISTYAGGAPPVPAPARGVDVPIGFPSGVATDAAGNAYFSGRNCVFKLDRNGIVTRVAGNSRGGYSGDGGPAAEAQLYFPAGLAVDVGGNLFIADSLNYRIRRVSPNGVIATVAGGGTLSGSASDGGPATNARLFDVSDVAVDRAGNLYLADLNRIRKVSPDGIITTVAGTEVCCAFGAWSFAVDKTGNLFIAGGFSKSIRKISPDGIITTVAENVVVDSSLAVDDAGNVFVAGFHRVYEVSPNGIITTVAGDGTPGFSGDGGPATSAQLSYPYGVAADDAGNVFIADPSNHRIRRVSPSGILTTVAGNATPGFSGDGGPASSAQLSYPHGVAVDGASNLFIVDSGAIRKVSTSGIITTVAQLPSPAGVAADRAGNSFIADWVGQRIHKVSVDGIITTVAGNGTPGFSGDGGPATSAQLSHATGVAVDGAGNVFIADSNNFRIRRVDTTGIITTVAGGGTQASLGYGGPATDAQLYGPLGVAVDGAGDLFITEFGASLIRKVSTNGTITRLAGTGAEGYSGDGGPAVNAKLTRPRALAVDRTGNVYVADTGNGVIRVLRPNNRSVLIGAVVDAASQRADPVSPGKIVVIYGAGLGPSELIQNQPRDGQFGTELGGMTVSFNGIPAPILYTSATQVAAVVRYAFTGNLGAQVAAVTVAYRGDVSAVFNVYVTASAPSLFTLNQTGAGQAAAINAVDGTVNTAANPVKIGGYISLYATGEGQTDPPGVDGRLAGSTPPHPTLPVKVTVGGIPATVQYFGGAPGQVAGLMQVNVQIPSGVQPGGYVPVVLQVGDRSSSPAVWIAVGRN